jgi:ATP-dependent DNA helicase RecG
MYQVLLNDGKEQPEVIEDEDSVTVIIRRNIIKPDILTFINRINNSYSLTQKESIFLGLLVQHDALTSLEAGKILGLTKPDEIKPWIGRLYDDGIIESQGNTSGMRYYIAPKILREVSFKTKTTLKRIEPHRLKELIFMDLTVHPESLIIEIHERIGTEINIRNIKTAVDKMRHDGIIVASGENRWTRYSLNKNSVS